MNMGRPLASKLKQKLKQKLKRKLKKSIQSDKSAREKINLWASEKSAGENGKRYEEETG